MQQAELTLLEDFSFGLPEFANIIKSHISESLQISDIAINKSTLLNAPLFCHFEEGNPNHIRINDLLKLFIDRWHQEIQYQQEILNLKNQIINEFDKICNQINDENLILIIKKQRNQVVEALLIKANFDNKHLAGDFCKCFMNGFETEMMEKIQYYITYVVWMPFTTPMPEGLVEFVKKSLHEEVSEAISEASILNASAKIIQFVQDQLEERKLQIQNRALESKTISKEANSIALNRLEEFLKTAKTSRKACSLVINDVGEDNVIISNERTNIQTIFINMEASHFLKLNTPFTYEYLELKELEDEDNFEQAIQIFQRLPKCLKSANLQFKNNTQNGMKIVNNDQEQKHKYELSFNNNDISYNQMKFLARLRNYIKFPLSIIIPNFQFQPKEAGTDEEIITLSNVFSHFKSFQHLQLNFYDASITTNAIDYLAGSIIKMNQIKYLNLDFSLGNNSASNNSMALFAQAISEMLNLHYLGFKFGLGNNSITDDGIVQLSWGIGKSASIQQLILEFGNGYMGNNGVSDKGIEELSKSIALLKNVQQLRLVFGGGNHHVSDKGMQVLAAALKNTNKISDLYLNFNQGKNSITDSSMDTLADAFRQMSFELNIYLNFKSNNTPRVTAKGASIIRNAKNYSKFAIYHDE